jgi:hypothetical protein
MLVIYLRIVELNKERVVGERVHDHHEHCVARARSEVKRAAERVFDTAVLG